MAGRERDDVVPVQTDGRGGITTRNTLHWKLVGILALLSFFVITNQLTASERKHSPDLLQLRNYDYRACFICLPICTIVKVTISFGTRYQPMLSFPATGVGSRYTIIPISLWTYLSIGLQV